MINDLGPSGVFRLIATAGILIFLGCCRARETYPVQRSILDGVETIRDPEYPRDGRAEALLTDDLIIGGDDSGDDPVFNRITDVAVDGDGRILVLDGGDIRVKVFSSSGLPLFAFGSVGQGPGDMQFPLRIALDPDDRILIYDGDNRRIDLFAREGEHIDTLDTRDQPILIGTDRDGHVFTARGTRWDGETGRQERTFERLDPRGHRLNRITVVDVQTGTAHIRRGQAGFTRTGYEHGDINLLLADDGTLFVGCSSDYLFSEFEGSGRLKRRFGRRWIPIPVQPEDVLRKYGRFAAEMEPLLPKSKPPFRPDGAPLLRENGRLWVPTFDRESEGLSYDVFGAEGIYERRIFLRAEAAFKPLFFRGGFLYSMDTDGEGYNRLRRSRLVIRDDAGK